MIELVALLIIVVLSTLVVIIAYGSSLYLYMILI